MKVVIATPLYPPEVADAGVYAKELAKRLSEAHTVTVVAYTHLPEELPGVRVVAIDKREPRFARLASFRKALVKEARNADAVIAINGASVELPALLGIRLPLVYCIADKAAHKHGGMLRRLAFSRATAVIQTVPGRKPEILPFEPAPTEALAAWEGAWREHLKLLHSLLT